MLRLPASILVFAALAAFPIACGNPQSDETPTSETATVATESPIATFTPDSVTTTPTPAGTPDPESLTDTGYAAPDGRPLYAECIQAGALLPPEFPVPAETQEPLPTYDPSIDPNEGHPTPAPAELPSFDPRSVAPADSSGWVVRRSACYDYSVSIPANWTVHNDFDHAGYQQGENASLRAPDGTGWIDVSVAYTTAYPDDPMHLPVGIAPGLYALDGPNPVLRDRRVGREMYVYSDGGEKPGVDVTYFYSLRDDWFLVISVYLPPPYSELAASEARAVLESLQLR